MELHIRLNLDLFKHTVIRERREKSMTKFMIMIMIMINKSFWQSPMEEKKPLSLEIVFPHNSSQYFFHYTGILPIIIEKWCLICGRERRKMV